MLCVTLSRWQLQLQYMVPQCAKRKIDVISQYTENKSKSIYKLDVALKQSTDKIHSIFPRCTIYEVSSSYIEEYGRNALEIFEWMHGQNTNGCTHDGKANTIY